MAWHTFTVAYDPIVADITKWAVAILKTKPPLVEGMGPRMEIFTSGNTPAVYSMYAGSDQGMFTNNVVATQVDLPAADDECYVALFYRKDGVTDWILSPVFHNITGNKSVIPTIVGPTPAGGSAGSCRMVNNLDSAQNQYLTHTATSFASTNAEMMFWVIQVIASIKLYFITANVAIPSTWMVSMNNAKSFEHSVTGIRTITITENESLEALNGKLDALMVSVADSKDASDTQFDGVHSHISSMQSSMDGRFDNVNSRFTNTNQVVQDQASAVMASTGSQISGVMSAIEGVHGHMSDNQNELKTILAGIGGIPQNVIDMIMDIHAEAMGSWSWDKRAGTLTMFDTHGLEAAVFSITDTPDVSSRERRTDLESS